MSLFQGAKNVVLIGGMHVAAGAGSVLNINRGEQSVISPAFRELSMSTAHTALHNSSSRYDAPRCHQNTRTKQLDRLERWILGLDFSDERIIWLCGGAGAGKSAIMQSIVERCSTEDIILGSFFFSSADPSRNSAEVLIPTLAYQVARAFPTTMAVLEPVINHDPLIFKASLQTQAYELLVRPIRFLIENGVVGDTKGTRGVFVIDGLDECINPKKQALIIDVMAAVLNEHSLPVLFLVASRPEPEINNQLYRQFNQSPDFAMLYLDNDEDAQADIRQFVEDSFLDIIEFHPLRDHIKPPWPTDISIEKLIQKSSGHFIYAAIAVQFIASHNDHPARSLKVVEGLEPARAGSPFAELDALYRHILKSAKYHKQIIDIMRHCFLTEFDSGLDTMCRVLDMAPDDVYLFLTDVQALISVSLNRYSGHLVIQPKHASLQDFFWDKARSQDLYMSFEVYHASLLTRFAQLLDNNSVVFRSTMLCAGDSRYKAGKPVRGGNQLIIALCKAIEYSANINTLNNLICRISPRDIWTFCEANGTHIDYYMSKEFSQCSHSFSVSTYMSAIRDSVANKDNVLYLHNFPTYVQLLLDGIIAPTKPIINNRIIPAFLFSSGPRALQIIQPLLFNFHRQFRIGIEYPCYLVHLVNSGATGTDPRTWKALKRMPQRNISWGADLAIALILVLNELLYRPRRPPLHFFNCHEQWLNRRKPAKSVAIGSPQLSTRFYGCRRGWPKFDYDRVYPYDLFPMRYGREATQGCPWDEGHRCILLLKTTIFFLRKADCTAELAKLARKALPREALWFPKLMKKARREMDAYVLRWEESPGALLERARCWKINDLD